MCWTISEEASPNRMPTVLRENLRAKPSTHIIRSGEEYNNASKAFLAVMPVGIRAGSADSTATSRPLSTASLSARSLSLAVGKHLRTLYCSSEKSFDRNTVEKIGIIQDAEHDWRDE